MQRFSTASAPFLILSAFLFYMIEQNYITIQGWMVKRLELSGNELILFALIFGFCQDNETYFTGSLNYISEWLNCSRPTVIKTIDSLVEKGLIEKKQEVKNNVKFNFYRVVKNLYYQNFTGSKETLPNNYINILDNTNIYSLILKEDISNNNTEKNLLFSDFDKNKQTTFSNNLINDINIFKNQFKDEIHSNIDVDYYFYAVRDWSDSNQKIKRTAKGWIATARNFMRKDKDSNKLKVIKQEINQIDYLKL